MNDIRAGDRVRIPGFPNEAVVHHICASMGTVGAELDRDLSDGERVSSWWPLNDLMLASSGDPKP